MSFTKKLLLVLCFQAALILGSFYKILDMAIKQEAVGNLVVQLDETEHVLRQNLEQVRENLKFSVRLTVSDFAFKQAFSQQDRDTILTIIENYKGRVKADKFVLLDKEGKSLIDRREASPVLVPKEKLMQAEQKDGVDYFGIENDQLFIYVIAPIRAPILRGFARIGMHISQELLRSIARTSNTNITILHQEGSQQYHQSSMEHSSVLPDIRKVTMDGVELIKFSAVGGQQVGKQFSLYQGEQSQGQVLVSKSEAQLLASYNNLLAILWKLLVGFGTFSVLVALFWGKTLGRRLARLTKAVTDLSGDNMELSISDKSNDEIGVLTRRFEEMAAQLFLYLGRHKEALNTIQKQKAKLESANQQLHRQIEEHKISLKIVDCSMRESNLPRFVDFAIAQLVGMKGIRQCGLMLQTDAENFKVISDRIYTGEGQSDMVNDSVNTTVARKNLMIAARSINEKKPYFCSTEEVKGLIAYDQSDISIKLGSFLCIPLIANNDSVGVLNFITEHPVEYWKDEKNLVFLQLIAGKISLALGKLFIATGRAS